jgi:alcohol-forming fatty acyl-CoA reductase
LGGNTGREVLLTGATGFVGKVVLEALLRRREALGVERVHVLVRPGADGSARARFAHEVERSACFARLGPGWSEDVEVVEGNLTDPGCGVSEEARARLAERVTHVLHVAASVEFDLPLAEAEAVNVGGCLRVLELARAARRLERMVSVSTAYVTPHPGSDVPVREVLAPLPRPAAEIRAAIRRGDADERALLRETGHPNTYTLTKCLAEHLLVEERGHVPLTLVRPSVVSASWRDPFPGWIDSAAAFAGFVALVGAGRMRAVVARPESRIDLVPVDLVAERILAAAFEGRAGGEGGASIVHAVAGLARSPSIEECRAWLTDFFARHPVDRRPGVPYLGPAGPRYQIAHWRHHELPLRLARVVSPRSARRAGRLRERIAQLNRAFPYFTQNSFDFRSAAAPAENAPEPRAYVETVCRGIHRHLLRRDDGEVPLAGRRGPDLGGTLRFALRQPEGTAALRASAWIVARVLRRCTDLVSFDLASFERAGRALAPGTRIVLAPSHRSYLDFVLCSYLAFARPDLGLPIPHVAAAVEFSRIPVLGRLLRSLRAFYLERGLGREDKALTSQVHALVREGRVLEFFIEGGRSRTRRFLEPKRGFLRSLQATGERFAILPVAVSYDRVPEEATLLRELAGEERPPMKLGALVAWTARLVRGRVALGRVHIACGEPVPLDISRDVQATAHQVIAELQGAMVATTFHLRAFLARAGLRGMRLRSLADAVRARGGRVLESALPGAEALDPRIERTLRQQFAHHFYGEARLAFGDHPVVAHQLQREDLSEAAAWDAAHPSDGLGPAILRALLEPICRDYQRVAEAVAAAARGAGPAAAAESPRALVRQVPECHLADAEAAFEDLVRRGVLVRKGERYLPGPRAGDLADLRARYAWPAAPAEPHP